MIYERTKTLLKKLLPRTFLFRYEGMLRYLPSLYYRGRRYRCNVCGTALRSFIHSRGEKICPRCGSIERDRRLWSLLKGEYLESGQRVLDFSPSRSLYRMLKKEDIFYTASDLSGDFFSDVAWDLTALPTGDSSLDLVICYHILEHIPEDGLAMEELFRTLSPGGMCLVQTPFREGGILEDPSITDPAERRKQFGQEDHLRVYSAEGLAGRLRQRGFDVEIRTFVQEQASRLHGMKEHERILLCRKPVNQG